MQIICTIATEKTKELAKSIDRSVSVTQNMIDTWRTYHPDTEKEYPTVDDLQEYLKANTETKKAIYFAVPRYYFQEYNPNEPLIQIDNNGEIILMAFPGNSLGYFWNKTGDNPDLRKLITNTNDAHRWLLWREMALMQRAGERTDENIAIAEKEATDKMREWKKRYPDQRASTLLDIVLSKFAGYYEGASTVADAYPNVPEELINKVGRYITNGVEYARPTEAEALKFLQAADPSLIPANVLAIVEKQRQQASQSNIPQLEPAPPQTPASESPKKQAPAIPKSTTGEAIVYVTGEAKTTKYIAMKNGAIDTLRHPNEQGMHFGNPFSHANYEGTIKVGSVKEAAEAYDAWLRGDEYYNGIKLALVDPERRQWIVNRILSGELKGKTLIYYTTLIPDFSYGVENYDPETAPNHAHILADYINGKRQVINEDVSSQRKTGIPAVDDAMDVIDRYSTWQRGNLSFDKETHTYFFKGKPINLSVTGYMEQVYGKPNIIGDYSFTRSMGNDTDGFTRDYFLQRFNLTINPMRKEYPNLSEKRKTELLKSEQRLENYLKSIYGQNCKIITRDMILAAKIKTDKGEETIAGAPDMIVIDEQGDLHLLDMKTKAHPIDRMIRGKLSDDRRNYTFQLNAYRQLIEACMPEFQGKVKDLTLIWFDQSYPKQMVTIDGRTYGEATYVTDPKTGAVTVSDRETDNQPLYLYYKWHTPALKEDVKQSLISLSMDKSPLENVRPIQSKEEIAVQEYKERQQQAQQRVQQQISTNIPIRSRTVTDTGIVITESTGGYPQRTKENADWSDITLALATDFNTAGETLTAQQAGSTNEKYLGRRNPREGVEDKYIPSAIPSDGHGNNERIEVENAASYYAKEIYKELQKKGKTTNLKLNIAGNGIYTFAKDNFATQEELNQYVYNLLSELQKLGVTIAEVRSGGQTGIDEAGVIAAQRLGIPTSVHAPKGFAMRDKNSKDTYEKNTFISRFGKEIKNQQPVQTSQNQGNNLAPTPEELNTIFPVGGQGTSSKNVIRSFGRSTVDTPDSQLPQQVQQQITGIPATDNGVPQDTTPDYNIPEIGSNAINLDESSEMSKLAMDFTPMQLYDRAESMARMFSEKVTSRVQQLIAENAQEMAEEMQKENKDMTNINRLYQRAKMLQDADSGRKFAIQDLTLKGLFDSMREEYKDLAALSPEDWEEEVGKGKGEYYADAYQKIVEHFDEILKDACNLIEGRENIRIIVDKGSYDTGITQEDTTTGHLEPTEEDMEKEEAEFGDDPEGERVEGNAGWYYKVRMVNPITSMSKDVKNTIYGVLKFGADGKPEYDDLGNPRYINGEYAHAVLINSLSGMISPDDFYYKDDDGEVHFPALERLQVKYPWVSQIIKTLKANPRLVSAFYADLRKDFIPYWIQVAEYNDAGERIGYKNVAVNRPVARESAKDSILDNYEQGTVVDVNSVYDSGRVVNKENAKLGNTLVGSLQALLNDFDEEYTDEEDYNNIVANSAKVFRMVGMSTEESEIKNLLKSTEGIKSLENAVSAAGRIFDGILDSKFDDKAHLIQAFNSDYNVIAEEIGLVQELNNISSFRIGDDTYYSYSAPNYMDTLFKNLSNSDEERRTAYLNTQFGQYKWFKNPETGEWNCTWLEQIENDEDVRDHMELKELKALPDPDVTKRDLIQYKDWTPNMIRTAFVREYFSAGLNEKSKKQYGWYNFPIFSDSPVVKFIKFTRYVSDEEGTFKDKILPLLAKVAYQELERMTLTQERKKKGVREISNFDKNGDKFNFFPELNAYRAEIDAYIEEGDTNKLHEFLLDKIEELMNTNYLEFLENSTSVREEMIDHLKKEGVAKTDQEAENALEEYFWNQAFATTQIIELCTTDLAYYKDSIDFQKRFKEVYAAGTKVNTNSKYGKKIERALYLADQIVTSSSYTDIKTSLDRAVEGGRIQNFDRDNILNKMRDINATDAQAYRCLPSMRCLLDMIGKWDDNMEEAFNRFENGEWNMSDFNLIWQTIKPFVFTQIGKPDGVGGRMKVPHQNKNSEFLLLAMYRLIAGSEGKSAKLRAIDRFMKDNDIDVTQFQSAVKAGGQGVIDISYSEKKLNDWKENNEDEAKKIDDAAKKSSKYSDMSNFEKFKAGNDYLLDNGEITQKEYNERMNAIEPDEQEVYDILEQCSKDENGEFLEEVLHEVPYDDYCIQQPTPEHLIDHIAVFGSQFRNLIIADMPNDPDFRVKVNGKDYTKEEILPLYNSLIVENLLDDWKKLRGKFETIETFQKALEDTVKGNPKYGRDILNAIQLVDDGEGGKTFNIPLDNPSTTLKIQEIVTSMFKNAIAKQSIKGGACILVSDFGLTSELHLRHDKETGALTGVECYMPASSREFFEPLMVEKTDDNGNKYMELDISKLPKDLRKAIGYRIPTEDKYSMAPLIIKGFLPQQNGSAIMLPADITTIAGSDFDVDKMFLMFYEFDVFTHDKRKARADYDKLMQVSKSIMPSLEEQSEDTEELNAVAKGVAESIQNKSANADALSKVAKGYTEEDIADPTFNEWFDSLSEDEKDKYKYDTPQIVKKKYDANKSPQEQRRAQRNNMIIDIAYAILTHPRTSESFHNPGSFDTAKIAGRVARISTNVELLTAFAIDNKLGTAEEPDLVAAGRKLLEIERKGDLGTLNKFLKDHTKERSQLTPETFVYNHYQNMTGGALIGIYANNTSMQAKFQGTRLALKDDFTFMINGHKMKSLHDIFSERGERISKNCANFSAASVDNVKDPILADLMQNKDTANIAGTMVRLGMSIEEVGLLFSQPDIKKLILERGNLKDLKDYTKQAIDDLKEAGGGVNLIIANKNFTSEELMDNITKNHMNLSQEDALALRARQIQALKLMEQIMKISDDVGELTRISKADSPTAAIDTSIAGAKSQVKRVERFLNRAKKRDKYNPFTLVGVEDGLKNGYVNSDMSIDELREKFLRSRVPLLQSFYSLGIEFGNSLMGKYFSQSSPRTDAMVDFLYDMSAYGMVDPTLLNKFYSELVLFALTKSPLFGDDHNGVYDSNKTTYEEKRDYYLYDFPKEYLRIIADNPDIAEMQIFKRIQVVDGTIIMKRQGKLTTYMRDSLMRDFDMLLYMNNPEAVKLATGLFMYAFYKDGFRFGPQSFGHLFSTSYVTSFPEFTQVLRNLKKDLKDKIYFDEFLPQFIANHWKEANFIPVLKERENMFTGVDEDITVLKDGRVQVASKRVLNRNLDLNNLKPGYSISYPYIIYKNKLYILQDASSTNSFYVEAPIINSGDKGALRYNANSTASKMAEIKTDNKRVAANKEINPSNKGFGYDDAAFAALEAAFGGEGSDAFAAIDAVAAYIEGGDDIGGDYLSYIENAPDYSPEAGEATLDQPVCK